MNEALLEAIRVLEEERQLLLKWVVESQSGGWSTHQVAPMRARAEFLLNKINELKVRAHGL